MLKSQCPAPKQCSSTHQQTALDTGGIRSLSTCRFYTLSWKRMAEDCLSRQQILTL